MSIGVCILIIVATVVAFAVLALIIGGIIRL